MVLTGSQDQEGNSISVELPVCWLYGQLAHAILSLWFTLLAIPSWILSALLPPLLGGGAIAVAVATTAVLLGSSSSPVALDSTACYLDTGCTSVQL